MLVGMNRSNGGNEGGNGGGGTFAEITRVGVSSAVNNVGTMVPSHPKPAGVQEGDFAIMNLTLGRDQVITEPLGWTLLYDDFDPVSLGSQYQVWGKPLEENEPASWEWSWTSGEHHPTRILLVYRGVDLANPLEDLDTEHITAGFGNEFTDIFSQKLVTTVPGCRLVWALFVGHEFVGDFEGPLSMEELGERGGHNSTHRTAWMGDKVLGTRER